MSTDTFSFLFAGILFTLSLSLVYLGARKMQKDERNFRPFDEARKVRLKS